MLETTQEFVARVRPYVTAFSAANCLPDTADGVYVIDPAKWGKYRPSPLRDGGTLNGHRAVKKQAWDFVMGAYQDFPESLRRLEALQDELDQLREQLQKEKL